MPRKIRTRTAQILLQFEYYETTNFADIRDFIISKLEEGHVTYNVKVSKPITPWRDPKAKKQLRLTVYHSEKEGK